MSVIAHVTTCPASLAPAVHLMPDSTCVRSVMAWEPQPLYAASGQGARSRRKTSELHPVQHVREQYRHRVVRVANDFNTFDGEVSGQKPTQRRFGVLDDMLWLVDWPQAIIGNKNHRLPVRLQHARD